MFLRGDPTREMEVLEGCLAEGGALHLVWQPFTERDVTATVERQSAVLADRGFAVAKVLAEDRLVCVVAAPAG